MNGLINTAGTTTLITFFVCARVYPRETAVACFLSLLFVCLSSLI